MPREEGGRQFRVPFFEDHEVLYQSVIIPDPEGPVTTDDGGFRHAGRRR